jgi:hypothetical protein
MLLTINFTRTDGPEISHKKVHMVEADPVDQSSSTIVAPVGGAAQFNRWEATLCTVMQSVKIVVTGNLSTSGGLHRADS